MIYLFLVAIFIVLVLLLRSSNKKNDLFERSVHEAKHPLPTEVPADVRELAARGDRLNAIKFYREKTGCSLAVATEQVDPLVRKFGGVSTSTSILMGVCGGFVAAAIAWFLS